MLMLIRRKREPTPPAAAVLARRHNTTIHARTVLRASVRRAPSRRCVNIQPLFSSTDSDWYLITHLPAVLAMLRPGFLRPHLYASLMHLREWPTDTLVARPYWHRSASYCL